VVEIFSSFLGFLPRQDAGTHFTAITATEKGGLIAVNGVQAAQSLTTDIPCVNTDHGWQHCFCFVFISGIPMIMGLLRVVSHLVLLHFCSR